MQNWIQVYRFDHFQTMVFSQGCRVGDTLIHFQKNSYPGKPYRFSFHILFVQWNFLASNIGKLDQSSLSLPSFNILLIKYSRLDWQILQGQKESAYILDGDRERQVVDLICYMILTAHVCMMSVKKYGEKMSQPFRNYLYL